jgi:hypothetical protein
VPSSWPRDWVRSLRTIAIRFDSVPRHQMLSRPDAALRLRSAAMQFDSAREHRRVEESGYLASLMRWSTSVRIRPLATPITLSNERGFIRRSARARLPRSAPLRSGPTAGHGPLTPRVVVRIHGPEPWEVSPPGEGCGFTSRRARFDSGTSYPPSAAGAGPGPYKPGSPARYRSGGPRNAPQRGLRGRA